MAQRGSRRGRIVASTGGNVQLLLHRVQGQVYLLVWAGGEGELISGVRKVGTPLLLRVFGLRGMDKEDPGMGDRGEGSTPARLPVGRQAGLGCRAAAQSAGQQAPRPQPRVRPSEERLGCPGVAFGAASLYSRQLCPGYVPADSFCWGVGWGAAPHPAPPLLWEGLPPLPLTLSAPSSFSAPLVTQAWLRGVSPGLGHSARDRSCCGQCPGPSPEAGFTSSLPDFGRTSSPQEAACPPSPSAPEVGRQGRRRPGWEPQSARVGLGGAGTGMGISVP